MLVLGKKSGLRSLDTEIVIPNLECWKLNTGCWKVV
jgi:hypothetical protein